MKPCKDCNNTKEAPSWPLHCPTCLWCGARLIARIQVLPRPRSEVAERCRTVLSDWVAMGHSEMELRRMVKAGEVLQPIGGAPASGSDIRTPAKRR